MTDTNDVPQTSRGRRPSPSPSSDSESEADAGRLSIQWLATAREKRSTAGNRMKAMLANEEPDSDLELLFAEDDDDQGFTDVGDDATDVHMDSSSSSDEDEGADEKGGELEGEKELEQQAREKRAAQRKKRKGQDAIPARFRKKVRIDPTTTATTASSASTTPRPVTAPPLSRPKKKSERASWLPSAADQPTRASLRHTTRLSKEQLHAQMEEREARRLRQMAQMQKKAERLEATKKPPLTQEQRLREAELVERRNAKSLNRWEVAEKQREEERRAKLAALNQRTLKGPVITFWSGTREWTDGGAARYVVLEEKPKRKPREKKDKGGRDKDKAVNRGTPQDSEVNDVPPAPMITSPDAKMEPAESPVPVAPQAQFNEGNGDGKIKTEEGEVHQAPSTLAQPSSAINQPHLQSQTADPPRSGSLAAPTPPPVPPSGLAAPAPPPPSNSSYAGPTNSKPSGVLAAPILAPPTGVDPYPSEEATSCHRSLPDSVLAAPSPQLPQAQPQSQPPQPIPTLPPPQTTAVPKELDQLRDSLPAGDAANNNTSTDVPPPAEDNTYTRNAIVYQNFDENVIKDKAIQTQILFGRRMNKLSKPPPLPICVITNHPAKYRDPKTGLPFYNSFAYRQIQRLCKGDYHWSKLLGAWVGAGQVAAKGVPDRFLNPDAPPPPSVSKIPKMEEGNDKVVSQGSAATGAATVDVRKQSSKLTPGHGGDGVANLLPQNASTNASNPATSAPAASAPKDAVASTPISTNTTLNPTSADNDGAKSGLVPAQTPVNT